MLSSSSRVLPVTTGRWIFEVVAVAGSVIVGTSSLQAINSPTMATDSNEMGSPQLAQVTTRSALADGTYLYGQTNQPEQLGQEYMVFQVEQGQVTGALYQPHSAFYCFQGQFQGNSLETVAHFWDAPEGQRNQTLAFALSTSNKKIASSNGGRPEVTLDGFVPLDQVSANDRRILQTCLMQYQ